MGTHAYINLFGVITEKYQQGRMPDTYWPVFFAKNLFK